MSIVPSVAASLGIEVVDPAATPEVYTELFRVARRLRESRKKVIGLLPASRRVAVAPTAIQLGVALSDACQGAVAVVDANTRWPAFRSLPPSSLQSWGRGFSVAWVQDFFALIVPDESHRKSLDLPAVEHVIRETCDGFVHVLVDITGYERLGEHWQAYRLIDAVVLVARRGLTRETDLLRRHGDIPDGKRLGVLLVG